jgi:hypothetical protein
MQQQSSSSVISYGTMDGRVLFVGAVDITPSCASTPSGHMVTIRLAYEADRCCPIMYHSWYCLRTSNLTVDMHDAFVVGAGMLLRL